jgi:hypothetical protein
VVWEYLGWGCASFVEAGEGVVDLAGTWWRRRGGRWQW